MIPRALIVLLCSAVLSAQGPVNLKEPATLNEPAPATYQARFDTSKGTFVVEVTREWAPLAADRFYNLVKNGFYDDARFFRVLDGFMAQFGLHADPTVSAAWRSANLKDEPVKKSNTRGFVSFAHESTPNSRYTMIFINFKDNSYLDADGFAPFGQVISGMDVADRLFSGYGRQNIPDQRRIVREGNAFLLAEYPKLDFVKTAIIDAATVATAPTQQGQGARAASGGVFTNRQADRGQTTFERSCERCHGAELGGEAGEEIPPLAWDPFITQWSGRS